MKNMKVKRKNKLIVSLDNKYKDIFEFDEYRFAKKVVAEILRLEKITMSVSINISIVNSRKIKSLNKITRNIDKVTDVLSYPNIPFKKPSDLKSVVKNKKLENLIFDYTTNTYFLGDIVICYNKVIEQSKKYNHSIKREYSFLLTHSMLHLLGYDHMINKDEKSMFEKQDKVLNNLKIFR